jgi:hypothetical protein
MTEVDSNHCQIVRESLSGERAADEQTFASLTILAERLERMRKLGKGFSDVTFSPDVEKLAKQKKPVAIC